MTWDGVVTKFHKKYIRELGIRTILEAYIKSIVLKKTLESISLDRRRGFNQYEAREKEIEEAVNRITKLDSQSTKNSDLNTKEKSDALAFLSDFKKCKLKGTRHTNN